MGLFFSTRCLLLFVFFLFLFFYFLFLVRRVYWARVRCERGVDTMCVCRGVCSIIHVKIRLKENCFECHVAYRLLNLLNYWWINFVCGRLAASLQRFSSSTVSRLTVFWIFGCGFHFVHLGVAETKLSLSMCWARVHIERDSHVQASSPLCRNQWHRRFVKRPLIFDKNNNTK